MSKTKNSFTFKIYKIFLIVLPLIIFLTIINLNKDNGQISVQQSYSQNIYQETDSTPIDSSNEYQNITQEFRFESSQIKYYTDISLKYEYNRVKSAFLQISNDTGGIINFTEVDTPEKADIEIYEYFSPSYDGYIIEGEAGILNNSGRYITKSIAVFYANEINGKYVFGYGGCQGFPQTEIHEILHAFGFGHNNNHAASIMAPYLNNKVSCKNSIDEEIINCLKNLYSNKEDISSCRSSNLWPNWENDSEDQLKELKWESLPVKYNIENCSNEEIYAINRSIEKIETFLRRNVLSDSKNDSRLKITCEYKSSEVVLTADTDYDDSGRPKGLVRYNQENGIINNATLYLFDTENNEVPSCGNGYEVTELIHGLGLRDYGRDKSYIIVGMNCLESVRDSVSNNSTLKKFNEMYPY